MTKMRYKYYLTFLVVAFLIPGISFAQVKTYEFEQLDSLQKSEKRNVVIFIHTDWCKYCNAMKQTTLKNRDNIAKLNEDFYFIELNAEERRNISFQGNTFNYKPTGYETGINELAEQLGTIDGKISYPTLCVLSPDNEIIFQYPQYIKPRDLLALLKILE